MLRDYEFVLYVWFLLEYDQIHSFTSKRQQRINPRYKPCTTYSSKVIAKIMLKRKSKKKLEKKKTHL